MNCPNCGKEFTGNFCSNCGTVVNIQNQPPYQFQQPNMVNNKTNGMAIGGFVLSCVSILMCGGIASIIGLILSIVGLSQIGKNGEKGKGLAIAGIIISSILFVFGIIFTIALIVTGGIMELMEL